MLKITKNVNEGFGLYLNDEKVKEWTQKRGLVDHLYKNMLIIL
jgi:hypothetical protein